ncbi:MAG: peptidylprolyl isomerase [Verrucomicrobiota bacterium]
MRFLILLLVSAGLASAAPAKPADKLFEDPVVAKGQGFTVTLGQVEEEFLAYKASMAASGRPVQNEQRDEFLKKFLERIIVTKLLLQRATTEDRAKAAATVEKFVTEAKKRATSEEAFNRQVESTGMTADVWRAKLLDRAIIEEVFNREVKGKITIADEQAKKFYDENPEKFRQKETFKIGYILKLTVDPRTMASPGGAVPLSEAEQKAKREELEKALARAKAGEDFAKLAKEFSEDPGSRDTGEVMFQRGQLLPDLEDSIAKLAVNEVSDIIKTRLGYQIVKLLERMPEHTVDFAKVQERIKEALVVQEADKKTAGYVDGLKKAAGVEILDERYKP